MSFCLQQLPSISGPVLDPYMGSGSTGVACIRLGIPFIGIPRSIGIISNWPVSEFLTHIGKPICLLLPGAIRGETDTIRSARFLVDINELSRLLSISKGTLYNWVYLRSIPSSGRALTAFRS